MIRVACPKCKGRLELDDDARGQVEECPDCGTRFRVPAGNKLTPFANDDSPRNRVRSDAARLEGRLPRNSQKPVGRSPAPATVPPSSAPPFRSRRITVHGKQSIFYWCVVLAVFFGLCSLGLLVLPSRSKNTVAAKRGLSVALTMACISAGFCIYYVVKRPRLVLDVRSIRLLHGVRQCVGHIPFQNIRSVVVSERVDKVRVYFGGHAGSCAYLEIILVDRDDDDTWWPMTWCPSLKAHSNFDIEIRDEFAKELSWIRNRILERMGEDSETANPVQPRRISPVQPIDDDGEQRQLARFASGKSGPQRKKRRRQPRNFGELVDRLDFRLILGVLWGIALILVLATIIWRPLAPLTFCVGGFVFLVSYIWLFLCAYSESPSWGVAVATPPIWYFAALIFVLRHFEVARRPFIANMAGVVMLVAAGLVYSSSQPRTVEERREEIRKAMEAKGRPLPAAPRQKMPAAPPPQQGIQQAAPEQ